MVAILIMSAKLSTLVLLKIKVYRKLRYDVITCVYNITKKVLSRDSNKLS